MITKIRLLPIWLLLFLGVDWSFLLNFPCDIANSSFFLPGLVGIFLIGDVAYDIFFETSTWEPIQVNFSHISQELVVFEGNFLELYPYDLQPFIETQNIFFQLQRIEEDLIHEINILAPLDYTNQYIYYTSDSLQSNLAIWSDTVNYSEKKLRSYTSIKILRVPINMNAPHYLDSIITKIQTIHEINKPSYTINNTNFLHLFSKFCLGSTLIFFASNIANNV